MNSQPQLDRLITASKELRKIVEGVRSERWASDGRRLKDTVEWCTFYTVLANFKMWPESEAKLREALQAIADEAGQHHEHNPISGVDRLPQGYIKILKLAAAALK